MNILGSLCAASFLLLVRGPQLFFVDTALPIPKPQDADEVPLPPNPGSRVGHVTQAQPILPGSEWVCDLSRVRIFIGDAPEGRKSPACISPNEL